VEKRRRPAWCDRVLWRSAAPDAVEQLSYGSAQMTVSDHMPVTATFVLHAREYDRQVAHCPCRYINGLKTARTGLSATAREQPQWLAQP